MALEQRKRSALWRVPKVYGSEQKNAKGTKGRRVPLAEARRSRRLACENGDGKADRYFIRRTRTSMSGSSFSSSVSCLGSVSPKWYG